MGFLFQMFLISVDRTNGRSHNNRSRHDELMTSPEGNVSGHQHTQPFPSVDLGEGLEIDHNDRADISRLS